MGLYLKCAIRERVFNLLNMICKYKKKSKSCKIKMIMHPSCLFESCYYYYYYPTTRIPCKDSKE